MLLLSELFYLARLLIKRPVRFLLDHHEILPNQFSIQDGYRV